MPRAFRAVDDTFCHAATIEARTTMGALSPYRTISLKAAGRHFRGRFLAHVASTCSAFDRASPIRSPAGRAGFGYKNAEQSRHTQ